MMQNKTNNISKRLESIIDRAVTLGYDRKEDGNIEGLIGFLKENGIECEIYPLTPPTIPGYYFKDGEMVYTYTVRMGNLSTFPVHKGLVDGDIKKVTELNMLHKALDYLSEKKEKE